MPPDRRLLPAASANVAADAVLGLLRLAVWQGSLERARHELAATYGPGGAYLWLLAPGGHLHGLIGLAPRGAGCGEVRHIAVQPGLRGHGIGRDLVRLGMAATALRAVVAETDRDAVGFYRALGFSVQSLGERYPGSERFLCRLDGGSMAPAAARCGPARPVEP